MNDWELLRDYAEHGSEAAFTQLVERHLRLVHAAALRQVRDPHRAEEVTQRTFCLLARKARHLAARGPLVGWLYRAACHIASETLRAERRRHWREQQAVAMTETEPAADQVWEELYPLLDEAMHRLGETDRNAILLRYFQHLPMREVAACLGLTEAAAKMRLSRGVGKLREHLQRRGVGISVAALTALLLTHGLEGAAPPASSVVQTALTSSVASTAVNLGSLLQTMAKLNPKWALSCAALLATVTTAGYLGLAPATPSQGSSTSRQRLNATSQAGRTASISGETATVSGFAPDTSPEAGFDLTRELARLQAVLREPWESRRVPADRISAALAALGAHRSAAAPLVVSEFRAAERTNDFGRQCAAFEALVQLGRDTRSVWPDALALLKENRFAVQNDGIHRWLVACAPDSEAISQLVDILRSPGFLSTYWVADAIRESTMSRPDLAAEAKRALTGLLGPHSPTPQLPLAQALAKFAGEKDPAVVTVLLNHLGLSGLRDPHHYAPISDGVNQDYRPVYRQWDDDAKRLGAVAGLQAMGPEARATLPALDDVVRLTPNADLREAALAAIGAIDPSRRELDPEVAEVIANRTRSETLTRRAQEGTANLDELVEGLSYRTSAPVAAGALLRLGEAAEPAVPALVEAFAREPAYDVAQALKRLAPERLVPSLQNPAAWVDRFGQPHPAREAVTEAASALGELGTQAAFALPVLREALERPDDTFLRQPIADAIQQIDPTSAQPFFTGSSLKAARQILVDAWQDAQLLGDQATEQWMETALARLDARGGGATRREIAELNRLLYEKAPEVHAQFAAQLADLDPQLAATATP